jgi:hypothetical protein
LPVLSIQFHHCSTNFLSVCHGSNAIKRYESWPELQATQH